MRSAKAIPTAAAAVPSPAAAAPLPDTVIVNEQYLQERLLLTPAFIRHHARRMGSFSKPRRFVLRKVLAYLDELSEASIEKAGARRKARAAERSAVLQLVDITLARRGIIAKKRRGA